MLKDEPDRSPVSTASTEQGALFTEDDADMGGDSGTSGDRIWSTAAGRAGEHGLLLGEELTSGPEGEEETGYWGPTACSAAGITYRQLDYWARTGLVEPSALRRPRL
jgi:hypothetical protein